MSHPIASTTDGLSLSRDPHGRLVCTTPDGHRHEGVVPVRAFPISAPREHISLVSAEGKELAFIARVDALPEASRSLLLEELAAREFMPQIQRIRSVSTFSTPSTWEVDTDRGPTHLVLKVEEDIRRLPERGRLLITSGHGIVFEVRDLTQLDRHSKRLLERFL
ncbi:cyanophycin metabolism-associated DUF1854 family protein [Ideonella paludis]|uniref:DUF1854 domain-containing protein n=1 Tax=Ideonella paludis TaxID=1233411 RepID=A0ABS5DVR8_9BURK|nr:DUF1854 domain-containing protein [Ideonella paludis]MBQ0935242.1 DUF1854 domain-containing protein [Ideonella paludis]